MKRKKISLRVVTGRASGQDLQEINKRLNKFLMNVIQLRKENNYRPWLMVNMDELGIWFDMPDNYTVAPTGSKEVIVKKTTRAKQRITVCLTAAADGTKYQPFIIFGKVKKVPKDLPQVVVVTSRCVHVGFLHGCYNDSAVCEQSVLHAVAFMSVFVSRYSCL